MMKKENQLSTYNYKLKTNLPQLTKTAYHEAGYAVVAAMYGGQIEYVFINHEGTGECKYQLLAEEGDWIAKIKIILAGPIAEALNTQPVWRPSPSWFPSLDQGAGSDRKQLFEQLQKCPSGSIQ